MNGVGARLVARGDGDQKPAWLRKTDSEARWGVSLCVTALIGLLFALPSRYAIHPRFVVPAIEGALLVLIVVIDPSRFVTRSPRVRMIALVQLYLLAATVAASLFLLVDDIINGKGTKAVDLLLGGGEIWLCNILVFALVYWEYDRGGAADRANAVSDHPDLLFPQMTDDHLARDWEPRFFDYFYVSFTNAIAFSPTDTMPLSRWCKALFTLEAIIALFTITLVTARAVNILPGG